MTTATLTLTDFLLARIAEDETAAFGTSPSGYEVRPVGTGIGTAVGGVRLRAECEAKRAIVEEHRRGGDPCDHAYDTSMLGWMCITLRLLALPYAAHPDFREEWRP